MDREEVRQLGQRTEHAAIASTRIFYILPIGTFTGIAMLLGVFVFLNLEVTKRRRVGTAAARERGRVSSIRLRSRPRR